ncbi:MAG: RimK family alpha-L-glutamate ligase [Bacteroidota bacterium]
MHIGILSRGPGLYSTQRLVEAGQQAGHQVSIIDHGITSLLVTPAGGSMFIRGMDLDLPDVVIPRIGTNVTAIGAATISQLDLLGIPHLTSADGLLLARDKMRSLQFLARHQIGVPSSMLVTDAREARKIARRLSNYPIVVKLLESTHGVGVALAYNRYQLERTTEAFLRLQDRVILQEFIGEANGSDIRAFVVAGKVVAAMERKAAAGEFRANMHRGATATAIALTDVEAHIALKTASLLNLDVAGVDLIRSKRGPLVMEVNASPGLEGIETCTGIDVAGAIIEAAVKLKV